MITFLFPGQGSQKKGMGEGLFDRFKQITEKADEILGYSIKELCLENPHNEMNDTRYTQPALYVVNSLTYLNYKEKNQIVPGFMAGHSLGEYNALFASGAFDFETGLKLVKKRGELMSKSIGGGMVAIIGLTACEINEILKDNNLSTVKIANYNTSKQIVISGPISDVELTKKIIEKKPGVKLCVQLKVSGAFHSFYMKEAGEEFAEYMSDFRFNKLEIPVISNVTAMPYEDGQIAELLSQQITSSVKWEESIRYILNMNHSKDDAEFIEIGPGKILTGMINNIRKENMALLEPKIDIGKREEKKQTVQEKENMPGQIDNKKMTIFNVSPESLGNKSFKKDYNLKYAYVTGGMYHGIASKELVVKMAKAGMLSFFGAGGLSLDLIENAICDIKKELNKGEVFGVNLLSGQLEESTVDLFLKCDVNLVEAAAYMQITPALVRYRLKGLSRIDVGNIQCNNKIIAKISRPEVAEAFLSPPPDRIIKKLLEEKRITQDMADMSKNIAMADDICVEADSGGHTDQGIAYTLMPAIITLKNKMMKKYKYKHQIRIGAAGGIGTPAAAAAAFILGADFILTGSINQCTYEASTSDSVKNLLQAMNVQDTDYAPAGDMFEFGAKVQVLRKGVFFPARANKLYTLYQQFNSIDEIDEKIRKQIQEKYFKKSFEDVYEECKLFYSSDEINKAEKNSKYKMALIFKWYFGHSTRLALQGNEKEKVDYQIHCGPALGAFNQWVKGTALGNWQNRNVDKIAEKLLSETAEFLNNRFQTLSPV